MDPSLGAATLLIGKLAFGAAGIAAGGHVLALARRGGESGPHAVAAAAIAAGSLGLVLFPLAPALPGPALPEVAGGAAEILLRVSFALLAVFVWRVFRPGSRAAASAAAGYALLLLGVFTWDLRAQPSLALYDATLPSAWAAQLSFALVFGWSCGEAALEWRRARRRLALGLAERIVANRYGLWVVATGALAGVCLLGNAVGFAQARDLRQLEGGLTFVRGLLYLPAVVAVWLGIFQPRWYRRALGEPAGV
jgi:hypothetical protein